MELPGLEDEVVISCSCSVLSFPPSVFGLFRGVLGQRTSISNAQKGKSVFLPGANTIKADRMRLVHRQNLRKMRGKYLELQERRSAFLIGPYLSPSLKTVF